MKGASAVRYDEERKIIHISARELIATARRGIATSLPCDSDEPELSKIPRGLRKKILGDTLPKKITYDFTAKEHDFELEAVAEKVSECELWFTSTVDRNPRKPKKEYTAQLRGEAFCASYAYSIEKGVDRVKLNCVYVNPETEEYAVFTESVSRDKLEKFFKTVDPTGVYLSGNRFSSPEAAERMYENILKWTK
jgi:hypothetical protein